MAPKKKLTDSEKKEKKKEAARRRREKIKMDPVLAALEAEKERKKYERKKQLKQVKLAKDMTSRELRATRKAWRIRKKASRDKENRVGQIAQHIENNSPPLTDDEEYVPIPNLRESRQYSGRKKVRKERSRVVRENKKLKKQIEDLKRQLATSRQRLYRSQKQIRNDSSPRKVVASLMKSGSQKTVAKKLLFSEVLKRQLKTNFQQLSSKTEKRAFGTLVVGNAKVLKKYRFLHEVQSISRKFGRIALTNNSLLRLRIKRISINVERDVRSFFEDDENTMLCPGKKDCLTRKKVKKQKRVLSDTLKNLYTKFCSSVNYNISYPSFCRLKPFWVVKLKASDRDTCLCKVHGNIDYLIKGLHRAGLIDKRNSIEVVRELCCDVRNVSCLQRHCLDCQDNQVHYLMFDSRDIVSYERWGTKIDTFIDKRTRKKRMTKHVIKEKVNISTLEAVDTFEKEIIPYLHHEGIVVHMFRSIKVLKSRMNADEVMIHCDFSENYAMKYATEIQSCHFGGSRKQFTLHTSQIYFKKDEYSSLSSQSMCTLSESLDHGPAAVWVHLQPIFEFIKQKVPRIKMVHILSDSPSTQYRNRTIFYLFAKALKESFPDLEVGTWNYSAAGHGKGAPDGVGGVLKRTADRVVGQGQDIDNFQRFVEVLQENVRNVELVVVHDRDIESMKNVIPSNISPFKGTMLVHQVVYLKAQPNTLTMNRLSCFDCYDCNRFSLGRMKFPADDVEDGDSRASATGIQCTISNSVFGCNNNVVLIPEEDVILSEPTTSSMSSPDYCAPGTYVPVRFPKYSKKCSTASDYKYVCCIDEVDSNGSSLTVHGLRSFEKSNSQFVVQDNDVCVIDKEDIIKPLPRPTFSIKKRRMIFSFPIQIEVDEQG